MTPRRRAIIIVSAALALLIGAILFVLSLRPEPAPPSEPPPEEVYVAPTPAEQEAADRIGDPLRPKSVASEPDRRVAAQQMADLFAERYGSWSTQAPYENMRDLLPVMTDRYRSETEKLIASGSAQPGATYEGVSSAKISSASRTYDEASGAAVIAVTLLQEKSSGSGQATSYRVLIVSLRKVGEDWRVDGAKWES